MDSIEAASAFLGMGGRSGMHDSTMPSETHTITGTATSDSADGLVMVDLEGYTVSADDSQSLELPTTVDVSEGDIVQVTLVGGTGKSPIVTGVVGGGDRLSNNVQDAVQTAHDAADAVAGVVDVKKYFFHDEDGAHVTTVAERADEGLNSLWDNTDLHFRDGTDDVARFGANGSQLGRDDDAHLSMDFNSMEIQDENNFAFFYAGDLRDENKKYQLVETFTGDGVKTEYYLRYHAETFVSVTIDGVETTDYTYSQPDYDWVLELATAPSSGASIAVEYITSDLVPAMTFGGRTGTVGDYSVAEGYSVEASGMASHAEGGCVLGNFEQTVTASGMASHAEGMSSTASGMASHAEGASQASASYAHAEGDGVATGILSHAEGTATAYGYGSHGEGNGRASGQYSHAEGHGTATGQYSHAEGNGTLAAFENQHVSGRYNISASSYAEIVGNGSADNARSNARTLDWNGNEELQGELYLGGCTANGETPYPAPRYNTLTSNLEYWDGTAWQSIPIASTGPKIYAGSVVKTASGTNCQLWTKAAFESTFHTTNAQMCGVSITNGEAGSLSAVVSAEYWSSGSNPGWFAKWTTTISSGARRFNYIVVVPEAYQA